MKTGAKSVRAPRPAAKSKEKVKTTVLKMPSETHYVETKGTRPVCGTKKMVRVTTTRVKVTCKACINSLRTAAGEPTIPDRRSKPVPHTQPPKPKLYMPTPYYIHNGERVDMKGRPQIGDTIAGRKIAEFEPDGRIIFAKPTPPPYDHTARVRILAASIDKNDEEAEETFEGTTESILSRMTAYTDSMYANRDVRVGLNLIGPAVRIIAALSTLSVGSKR